MPGITVTELVFDRFDEIMAQFGDEAHQEVRDTARLVREDTQRRAPVATGELRDSYRDEETGRGEAAVYTEVEHSVYQEFGTYKMAAQPHLGPAAEAQRQPFINRMSRIGSRLR